MLQRVAYALVRRKGRARVGRSAIDTERTLPDVLSFDPPRPATYLNGRVFTHDVIDRRLAFLARGVCPPSGLKSHTDILKQFPYIGTPHQKRDLSFMESIG
jgi:hypothetical protein